MNMIPLCAIASGDPGTRQVPLTLTTSARPKPAKKAAKKSQKKKR